MTEFNFYFNDASYSLTVLITVFRLSTGSHVDSFIGYPYHLTKYSDFPFLFLLSNICSTIYSSWEDYDRGDADIVLINYHLFFLICFKA